MTMNRVAVIFEPGKRPNPQWFKLDGKKVLVTGINYYWETFEGAAKLENYSVSTDGAGLCELNYNTKEMIWNVEQK